VPLERLVEAPLREGLLRDGVSGMILGDGGSGSGTRPVGNQIAVEARDGGVVLNGQFIGMQSHPFAGRVF
jgi:hypothetical protein